jgi:hypothetical protein
VNFRAWSTVVLSMAAPALMSAPAAAQQVNNFLGSDIPPDLQRGAAITVLDRPHPELEPLGIQAGSMMLFPALTTSIGYTSNVYGSTTGAVAGGFATEKPEVALISQWSRNFLEFIGSGDIKRYFDQPARNETGYDIRADGRLDFGTGDNIVGLVHRKRGYEEQYSGTFPQNSAGAIGFNQTDATVRGTLELNRLRLIGSGRINDLVFSPSRTLSNQLLDERYRNRTEYHAAVRMEYAFNPDIAAFTEASFVRSDYRIALAGQPLRNNNATRFLVGGNFDFGRLVRGTIGVGYEKHEYDLSFYLPIRGIAFDAQLQWLPTDLTTVNFQATRKVEDAINANSPGYFASLAQLRIDHELLRYVQLFAETTYERDSFVAITRRDRQYSFHAGATYSVGRHFKLIPSAWYIDRASVGTPVGQPFKEVRGTLALFTQW